MMCKSATPLVSLEITVDRITEQRLYGSMDEITKHMLRIQRFVGSARITKSELARRAGLPITTLIGMEDPDWNPKSTTLSALVRALDGLDDSVPVKKNAKLRRLVASAA